MKFGRSCYSSKAQLREYCLDEKQPMGFISTLSIFVSACFVGYYIGWPVTPVLHTSPLAG